MTSRLVSRNERRGERRRAGISTVEAAFVFPVLIMLVFGMGELSVAFTRWQALTAATQAGARVAMVWRDPCVAATVDSEVETTVQNYAGAMGIDAPVVEITPTDASCAAKGDPVTVKATIPYGLALLPSADPTWTISATTVMRHE